MRYFDRYEFPDRIDDDWLSAHVHGMTDREWVIFLWVLGGRGWEEHELRQRVFVHRWP